MRILAIAATVVLIVLSGAAIVGAFAVLARRLLGLGFGLVRLLLAGLVGFAVAGPIFQAMSGTVAARASAITPVWFLILAAAAALLVAMTFLVVAEALVPSGSLPNPLELRRQLRGRIARARRYWQISRIAIHHGLLPYLRGRHLTEQLEPAAVRQSATEEVTNLLPMLRRLPRRIERIASAAEHGRLSVQVRLFADERDRRHVTGVLHQVLLTILAATAGIMAVLLLGTGGGPRVTTAVSLDQLFGYNLLVICSILALRVLVLIFRPDR